MTAQRVERHGRSQQIRNAHILARSGRRFKEKLGVDWRTVKDAEKRVPEAEYKTIDLKGVTRIGIDELYVFSNARKNRKYITVVRDLGTGHVLNVSRGKGEAAPIVLGHLQVIMKMSEHINNIRRMAMAQVNSDTRKRLADLVTSDKDRETIKRIMLNAKKRQEKAKKHRQDRIGEAGRQMSTTLSRWLHNRRTPHGHPRVLGVPQGVERLCRGVQQQDPLADQASLRLPRLQVLPPEGIRPAGPEVARRRLLTPILVT